MILIEDLSPTHAIPFNYTVTKSNHNVFGHIHIFAYVTHLQLYSSLIESVNTKHFATLKDLSVHCEPCASIINTAPRLFLHRHNRKWPLSQIFSSRYAANNNCHKMGAKCFVVVRICLWTWGGCVTWFSRGLFLIVKKICTFCACAPLRWKVCCTHLFVWCNYNIDML